MTPSDRKLLLGVSIFIVVMTVGGYFVGQYWQDIKICYYTWRLDSKDEKEQKEAFDWLYEFASKSPEDGRLKRFYRHKKSYDLLPKSPDESWQDSPLHEAITKDNAVAVRIILGNELCIDTQNRRGDTPLHYAMRMHNVWAAERLLACGADVNARDRNEFTPLHTAAENDSEKAVALLVEHGGSINARDKYGRTPLWLAVRDDNKAVAQTLLNHGADVNVGLSVLGFTPLDIAKKYKCTALVHLLEEHGAKSWVDLPAETLFEAARVGNLSKVKELLASGADVNERSDDRDGWTPLHVAAFKGYSEIAQILLEKGSHVNVKTLDSLQSPLHMAAQGGHVKLAELLVANGADINSRGGWAYTPLSTAQARTHCAEDEEPIAGMEAVENFLLYKSAKTTDEMEEDSLTLLHRAALSGNGVEVWRLLNEGTEDINARTWRGYTPLHCAVRRNAGAIVELLLAHGSDVNTCNAQGSSPLDSASHIADLAASLRKHGARTGEEINGRPSTAPKNPLSSWPTTIYEAVNQILAKMSEENMERIRNTAEANLILFHHGWGTGIRNEFGLWRGNEALLRACGASHPDDASMVIIKAVWERLQKTKKVELQKRESKK